MDDSTLYRLCQEYGNNARMWSRKFAALLPEVDKRQLYRKRGFYSIFEFAAKLAGMGRKNVEEVLRTYKVDKKTALEFRKFQQQLEKEAKIKIPLGKVLSELLTKIEPAPKISSVLGKSKKVTRYIPVQTKREAVAKHNGKCAYPSCNKPYQEIHHPQRFAIKRSHADIVPLCKNQHRIGLLAWLKTRNRRQPSGVYKRSETGTTTKAGWM